MSKLPLEYQGFLKFISRANKEIVKWFGPHCNYEPSKIVSMSAIEWEVMSDDERQYFIKSHLLNVRKYDKKYTPTGKHPFLAFLLKKRYDSAHTGGIDDKYENSHLDPYKRRDVMSESKVWNSLSESEREKYSNVKVTDLCMDHVIEKRGRLHDMYEPKQLHLMEFILKTEPKSCSSPRIWFFALKQLSPFTNKRRWRNLDANQRKFYENCSKIDVKRYKFERTNWLTKLLTIDMDSDVLTLPDMESQRSKFNLEAISSMVELKKDPTGTSLTLPVKPSNPFALFMKEFTSKMKDTSDNMKAASEAWATLSEEKKQVFQKKSRKMATALRRKKLVKNTDKSKTNPFELFSALFKHSKITNGPTRPTHLIKIRIPRVEDIYGKAKKLPRSERKNAWDALSDQEQEPYLREYDKCIETRDVQKRAVAADLEKLKALIGKAKQVEQLKIDMKLILTNKLNKKFLQVK